MRYFGLCQLSVSGRRRKNPRLAVEMLRFRSTSVRSIWRIARPLSASWNIFNPSRDKISLQHWGVVIARFDLLDLDLKLRERKTMTEDDYLEEIHELKRDGKNVLYDFREWKAADVEKKSVVTYVGQTKLSDEEIMDKGSFVW